MSARRWITLTKGAYCSGCEWAHEGGTVEDRAVQDAARRHANETGHAVQVERGQTFHYDPAPAPRPVGEAGEDG